METNHNRFADTTHNAGGSSRTLQGSTIEQAATDNRWWVVEVMDSDGNDGTYELAATSAKSARRAALAEHDRDCGHGAYAWIVSCEEQE